MPAITVYGGRQGSSFRPHWMLAELGLAYETKSIDMSKGENKTPEYLALNPTGQIPTLVYDDFVLTESAAMVHYLAEKHDPSFFGPNNAESHATMMRWQYFILLDINPNFTVLALKKWGMPQSEEAEAKANQALAKYLPVFEGWLSTREFVVGDAFTVADIVTRPAFMYAEFIDYDLAAYPAIRAWMKRCADRPAYQKASGK